MYNFLKILFDKYFLAKKLKTKIINKSNKKVKYFIYDELHAEFQNGNFDTFDDALNHLRNLSQLPWNEPPNQPPCIGWENCKRMYYIFKYEISNIPWIELDNQFILTVSSKGIEWKIEYMQQN